MCGLKKRTQFSINFYEGILNKFSNIKKKIYILVVLKQKKKNMNIVVKKILHIKKRFEEGREVQNILLR